MKKPAFITFAGGWGPAPVEQMMARAQRAMARDALDRAMESESFDGLIVVSDGYEGWESLPSPVVLEATQEPFHFGKRLLAVVRKHRLDRLLYLGAGSLPLLTSEDLARIARRLGTGHELAITNNLYSGDLLGLSSTRPLERVPLPPIDNPMPQLLSLEAGLEVEVLPRGVASLLDVDTPTDLMVMGMHPATPPRLREYLDTLDLDYGRVADAIRPFTDQRAEIVVAGRVGSYVWSRLEEETACRCRIISEERGMRADGREGAGAVRSILGQYLEAVTPRKFFRSMAELGDAAFIDSRVIFRHLGLDLSTPDRFHSDLLDPQEISNPWLREFTEEAAAASIPVVLGGHSLVSGGLLALTEAAWAGADSVDRV